MTEIAPSEIPTCDDFESIPGKPACCVSCHAEDGIDKHFFGDGRVVMCCCAVLDWLEIHKELGLPERRE